MVYVSDGNRRMKIPTFSLISEHTCPNSTPLCIKNCYAKKAERAYPTAYISRLSNTFDSLKATFVDDMIREIKQKESDYIRIHEAGDFYSQEYLDKWFRICSAIPDKSFLVFTQMFDLNWSNVPPNLVVYWTVWPDSKIVPEKGLMAYVIDNGKKRVPPYKYKITGHTCKKGRNSKSSCGDCLYCFKGLGNVKFEIH